MMPRLFYPPSTGSPHACMLQADAQLALDPSAWQLARVHAPWLMPVADAQLEQHMPALDSRMSNVTALTLACFKGGARLANLHAPTCSPARLHALGLIVHSPRAPQPHAPEASASTPMAC